MAEALEATVPESAPDSMPRVRARGAGYIQFLGTLHKVLQPRTYLEIGTSTGNSLAVSQCASVAVDPQFRVASNVVNDKPLCAMYQMGSDAFFAAHDPKLVLGGPIDLAFLDGMHIFEFLLRDFINTEKHCRKNSIVTLHDCVPFGYYMTARSIKDPMFGLSSFGGAWTGDVWKILPVLRKYRPDLAVTVLDCSPTGLVMITNLDPDSTVLTDNYRRIVDEFSEPPDERAALESFWDDLELVPSANLMSLSRLSRFAWL